MPLAFLLVLANLTRAAAADSLSQLANDFWVWRAQFAPFTGDDVNRMERPGGKRDWSRTSIETRRRNLAEFEARWKKIDAEKFTIAQKVDLRLIGSALARVRWELEINPRWKRDPNFYLDQTLTAVTEALRVPAPYDAIRSTEILTRLENIPPIIDSALENLQGPPAPFVNVAIEALGNIRPHLREMAEALLPHTTLKPEQLNAATERAADALEKFRRTLQERLPSLPQQTALGRDAYVFFLKNVALYPFSPEEILAMGEQEWNRAVAFETYERERNRDILPLKLAQNIDVWINDAGTKEGEIREFLEKHNILTVPGWMQHYTLRPIPKYLAALGFSENDDFTSPSRLNENCVRYTGEPSEKLGYFWKATAMDPRPITCMKESPATTFNFAFPGNTKTRSGGITTTPGQMKASVSTPRK
jgi:Bacterial protein of unknown function (DUF885)